ncbi:hypothetical protein ACOSP7_030346 [Xanthoceras sorbifolium]
MISRSSTKAEYRSLVSTVAELTWLKSLLHELRVPQPVTPTMRCDNLSIIAMSNNSVLPARTKHIKLDLYFVRDKVAQKEILVNHVPSLDQVADIFTKALSTSQFHYFKVKLTIASSPMSLRGDISNINSVSSKGPTHQLKLDQQKPLIKHLVYRQLKHSVEQMVCS